MSEVLSLFRRDARPPGKVNTYGEVVLIRPLSITLFTVGSAAVALAVIVLFVWGSYTRRTTVRGILSPQTGLIRVYPTQSGTIIELRVGEGTVVRRGDTLYVMSSDRRTAALGDTQASISTTVEKRKRSLQAEILQTRDIARSEETAARERLRNLLEEADKVADLLADLRSRVALSEKMQSRYEALRAQGHVSPNDVLVHEADLLDQRARMKTLERDAIGLQRQISDQRATLRELPLKQETQLSELERALDQEQQQLTQSESIRRWLVIAPEDGTVSAITGEVGHTADPQTPLLSIIPAHSKLRAQLYVPSRAMGFVRAGDRVLLRYQAFPYQKFGYAPAAVSSVSRTAVPAAALADLRAGSALPALAGDEPMYRVEAMLESQTIRAYGTPQSLQPGMLLDADLMHEKRRIYEWVLEPLITIGAQVH